MLQCVCNSKRVAMIDISVKNIIKAFEEGNNILDGISFEINEGERVGILGKNGAGKTTLFRVISGEMEPDEGTVAIPQSKRLGLISQIPVFDPSFTAEDVLRSAFDRLAALKEQMEELEKTMETAHSAEIMRQYDKISYDYQLMGGYDMDFEVNRVANGLEIPQAQRSQLFSTLSGGEQTRANLARLILENTDVLLLDEPTNHLDMRATEWLEEYLAKFKGTVLVISHDRYFLDKVIGRTVEISNGKAEHYGGNYTFYVQEKARRFEEKQKAYEKEQSEAKRLQESADRLYQWGTGNKNLMKKSFAIEKRIERLVKTDRPTKEKRIAARFGEKEFRGDEILSVKGAAKTYGEKTLFSDVELEVVGGERIALVGDNGTGKTTFIRLLVGEEAADKGFSRMGPSVKPAYLPQTVSFANPYRSILDTVVYETECSPQTARNRLGAFKFSGEDVFKPVGDLSGGEKSRLRLCILMKDDINLLILDEPTNHLDIASREWMEDALGDYDETLLFISHDRYFIDKFATRVWELKDGRLNDFHGGFAEYQTARAQTEKPDKAPREAREASKDKRKKASPQKHISKIERDIEALEKKLTENRAQKEAFATDYSKLMELDEEEAALQKEIDGLMETWESLQLLV